MNKNMNFSVLLSVYNNEKPEYFNQAIKSIWYDQTLKPNEIVLVEDGVLGEELNKAVKNWQEKLSDTLKVITLPQNVGLGVALNEGIKHCAFEWVARMDTDDISHSKRFEKQIGFLESHSDIDVLGSWIGEFESDSNNIYASRNLPCTHQEIAELAKKRTPINHMTAIFRKSTLLRVGGYGGSRLFQDYQLWARMIQYGAKFANLPEKLVSARGGRTMIQRRGGINYAIDEYKLQKEFLQTGFISYAEFLRNVCVRFSVRMIPCCLRAIVYNIFLRHRSYGEGDVEKIAV